MFEICGILNEEDLRQTERLCANLTFFIPPQGKKLSRPKAFDGDVYDFTDSFADFKKNVYMLRENKNKKIIIMPLFSRRQSFTHRCATKLLLHSPQTKISLQVRL